MLIPAHFSELIHHYGSFAIFGLLAFGIIGLPIPDETLLIFAGFLIANSKLGFPQTLVAAILGSACGITVSFIIGRTIGYSVFHRYGKYLGVTDEKLKKAHNWFEKFGKWLVFMGYFIPGVRHLTGISAGVAKLKYWEFAVFAYTGAIIWASLFVCIGYFFYTEYQHFHFL